MLSESYVRQTTKLTDLYIRTPLSIEPGLYIMLDTNFRESPECELRQNGVRRSSLLGSLRARTNRSWAAGGKGLPAIAGPGFSNEPSHDDDRVGKGHPEVDDSPFPLGAPHKLLMGIAPRIGSFYDPGLAIEALHMPVALPAGIRQRLLGPRVANGART